MNVRSGKASAVMQFLPYSVVLKSELLKKIKSLVFNSKFVFILTYDHNKSLIMTKRVRLQLQAFDFKFLQKEYKGFKIFNKVCNTAIREFTNSKSLSLDRNYSVTTIWSCWQNTSETVS